MAFARSPMTVAAEANDLQQFSRGRFTLGLGSQVRAHIERRFSMQWSHPASRMRDFVLALRAIWASWNSGEELRYEGEFYSHTLQPPLFNPGPNPFGAPRVVVAAVGPNMAKVAGEVGDGVLVHAFTTPRYLREVTLPAVTAGLEVSGRRREDFEVFCPAFVVTGSTEAEIAAAARVVRRQLAFYGSTPAYRPVLEVQGQGELAHGCTPCPARAHGSRWAI